MGLSLYRAWSLGDSDAYVCMCVGVCVGVCVQSWMH